MPACDQRRQSSITCCNGQGLSQAPKFSMPVLLADAEQASVEGANVKTITFSFPL